MLIHAAAHSDAFKAIVSEGASGQSLRDGLANGDTFDFFLGGGAVTLATALFTNTLPPPSLKSEALEDRSQRPFPRRRRERAERQRDEAEHALLRSRGRAEADLGSPERPAHRRDRHGACRVRAAGHRVPQRCAAGGDVTASVQDERLSSSDTTSGPGSATRSRLLREAPVARVAIGLVGLHVADDSFLQPQPGTSSGDHLVSGLVPLTVLMLAAWAHPRVRAGFRALIALAMCHRSHVPRKERESKRIPRSRGSTTKGCASIASKKEPGVPQRFPTPRAHVRFHAGVSARALRSRCPRGPKFQSHPR